MKKYFLTALFTISFLATQAQSNKKGTFHIGLGTSADILGGSVRYYYSYTKQTTPFLRQLVTLKSSYGLSKRISTGLYVSGGYIKSTDYKLISCTFGIEGKYYVINKEKLNIYFAPSVGYLIGNETSFWHDSYEKPVKTTGINYCFTVGFNKYWTERVGYSVELGYSHLDLTFQDEYPSNVVNSNVSYNGVTANFSLVAKFGGK